MEVGVGYPYCEIIDASEGERVELVGVGGSEGSSFGGALWHDFTGVDVDVGGVGSCDNIALEVETSKQE